MREVVEATGLSRGRTERLIRTAVAGLLGPGLVGLGALYVVCGQPFMRDRLHSPRVTCSPACARARTLASLRASGGDARLAEAARRRGREATGKVRALFERAPAAFASLPPRDGLAVRLFHGLPVEGLSVEFWAYLTRRIARLACPAAKPRADRYRDRSCMRACSSCSSS